MHKNLVIVVNDPAFFLSHRAPIALKAKAEGYNVTVATSSGPETSAIQELGLKHIELPLARKGTNPFAELGTLWAIFRLFKKTKPHIVHLVTIKPVLYGGIAAKWAGVPAVLAAVSGMGSVFIARTFKAKLLQGLLIAMYRYAFSHRNMKVIFQNPTDQSLFVSRRLISHKKTVLIRGSGVDLACYPYLEEPLSAPIRISMACRLLKDKGVYEYVEAARILKKEDTVFQLIGKLDDDNPSAVSEAEIKKWKAEGIVNLLGFRSDIAQLFSDSHLVVLPSYREGLPKALIEAAACGRAVVTTDVPGCRDAIESGVTGLLVEVRNAKDLAEKINWMITHPDERRKMGFAGRKLAEKEFDIQSVVAQHLMIYRDLIR